jgi:hypothetical protein
VSTSLVWHYVLKAVELFFFNKNILQFRKPISLVSLFQEHLDLPAVFSLFSAKGYHIVRLFII